ncbi:MAG: hypothetical protein NC489_40535 [Ruminococcus flavefaciens]|nr:hypothetical protein [Ruminococcus flavefaciens]
MNKFSEISRNQLEESGEILKEKEGTQQQFGHNHNQETEWDSLKDVPFRGGQELGSTFMEEIEEEMGM